MGKSLSLYDERRGRIKVRQSIRVLRTLFFPESRRPLKRLSCRGLVILGEHDVLYNANKLAQRIGRLMPTLETEVVPGTGHSVMYDKPDRVNALMLAFLREKHDDGSHRDGEARALV